MAQALQRHVLELTDGAPIILNLEGVIIDELPQHLRAGALTMPSRLARDWLTHLNVVAVSLANNHSMDFGPAAYAAMAESITEAGIVALHHGAVRDMGPFRLVALTDLSSSGAQRTDRISDNDLNVLSSAGVASPLFAFMHWGKQGVAQPRQRELTLADHLRRRAVVAIVGAHPHTASVHLSTLSGGQTLIAFSLGNFLFDQSRPDATGALLEVRFFDKVRSSRDWCRSAICTIWPAATPQLRPHVTDS